MARPLKQTVDYFPHYCDSSKTIPILESKFGNDGYAFLFKLLELLAKTEGHYYDCSNLSYWEFLLAKTRVSEETAKSILAILADLGKIDKELWVKRKIIWCQNLVNNVADVYARRQSGVPARPSSNPQKPQSELVSDNRKRQSKVKYSKGEESRGTSPLINQVFIGLKSRRGYESRQRVLEAEAIKGMLGEGFSPGDILKAYDVIKKRPYFRDRSLTMMLVRQDIHEVRKIHVGGKGYPTMVGSIEVGEDELWVYKDSATGETYYLGGDEDEVVKVSVEFNEKARRWEPEASQ